MKNMYIQWGSLFNCHHSFSKLINSLLFSVCEHSSVETLQGLWKGIKETFAEILFLKVALQNLKLLSLW